MVKNIQQQITHRATYESIVDSCEERKFGPNGFGAISKWAAPPRGLQSAAPAATTRTSLSATPWIDQNGSRWSRAGKGTTRCSRAPKLHVKFDGSDSLYIYVDCCFWQFGGVPDVLLLCSSLVRTMQNVCSLVAVHALDV